MKTALILGHPGHELRVFRFLELHRPVVYVLTDGSGNNGGASRLPSTLKVLEEAGCQVGSVFGRFTDQEIYEVILKKKEGILQDLIEEVCTDLQSKGIERLAGDACEGYNPTHDLCRYMVNIIAEKMDLPNYDFLLDGPPHLCPEELRAQALWIRLAEGDFERKLAAAANYPELKFDLEETLKKHGKAPFMIECLRPVEKRSALKTWQTPLPHYETYAKEKIQQGKYQEVISFETHVRPLVEGLQALCVS
jgi:hypothetical protein